MDFLKKIAHYVVTMFIAVSAFAFVAFLAVAGIVAVFKTGIPEDELPNLSIHTEHAVGVVELTGEILTSEKFEKSFEQLIDNARIKAIVVRIDSPGGAVGASEEIYRLIKDGTAKKPVVCSLGTVAASGGLFAAIGCQKIVANESTLTGSIGVIMMSPNVDSLLDRFGVDMTIVKSGKYKDTGSPFREVTSEDREYLQRLIDRTYAQFVQVIATGRSLKVEDVKKFADGRIILGGEAKELGLIDEVGGLPQAAKMALLMAGDSAEPEIVRTKEAGGFLSFLRDAQDSRAMRLFQSLGRAQILYRAFF